MLHADMKLLAQHIKRLFMGNGIDHNNFRAVCTGWQLHAQH